MVFIVQYAPKLVSAFFQVNDGVQIDKSKPHEVITADLLLVHKSHLQISAIQFITAVDIESEGLLKFRIFASFLNCFCFLLLVR